MSLEASPVVRVTASEPELPPTVTSSQISRTRKRTFENGPTLGVVYVLLIPLVDERTFCAASS